MPKICLKCGFIHAQDDSALEQCPQCGAIYAKVEEAIASGILIRRNTEFANVAETSHSSTVKPILAKQTNIKIRPALWAQILIAFAITITLCITIFGIAIFGMILTAPGSGGYDTNAAWGHGFKIFVTGMIIGGAVISSGSFIFAFNRRIGLGTLICWPLGIGITLLYWWLKY